MSAPARSDAAIWHDVECGAYAADLPTWLRLADEAAGPILELGSGTGRVSLHLAAAGHEVVALDQSAELLAQLRDRAQTARTPVGTMCADARAVEPSRSFALVLAPMQLVHLMGGEGGRRELLRSVAGSLRPGGRFAAALLGADPGAPAAGMPAPPLPDVREVDGWVYSSLPVDVTEVDGRIEVRRLRQIVSPEGELSEALDEIQLDRVQPDAFEAEAAAAGLERVERIAIEETDDHVGSVVCVMEASR